MVLLSVVVLNSTENLKRNVGINLMMFLKHESYAFTIKRFCSYIMYKLLASQRKNVMKKYNRCDLKVLLFFLIIHIVSLRYGICLFMNACQWFSLSFSMFLKITIAFFFLTILFGMTKHTVL